MAITCDLCGKSVKAPQNLRVHKFMKHGVQPDGQASATPAAVATLADSEKTELAQLRELRDGWQVAVATPENFTRLGASLGYTVNASGSSAGAAGKELEQPAKEAPMTRLERIGAALLEERKGLPRLDFETAETISQLYWFQQQAQVKCRGEVYTRLRISRQTKEVEGAKLEETKGEFEPGDARNWVLPLQPPEDMIELALKTFRPSDGMFVWTTPISWPIFLWYYGQEQ